MRCAYVRHLWDCGETIEIEEKHTGRYGARGQKREKRKKASPEDIKRQNKWKRERDLRRLIKWNFGKYDYWMTITYRKGDRPAWEQMKKDVTDLIKKVRKRYRNLSDEGLPVELAEVLNYTDADACKKSMETVKKAFQTAVEKAVDEKLKGGKPPKKAPETNTQEALEKQVYNAMMGIF